MTSDLLLMVYLSASIEANRLVCASVIFQTSSFVGFRLGHTPNKNGFYLLLTIDITLC
jgi:hypothetical protein